MARVLVVYAQDSKTVGDALVAGLIEGGHTTVIFSEAWAKETPLQMPVMDVLRPLVEGFQVFLYVMSRKVLADPVKSQIPGIVINRGHLIPVVVDYKVQVRPMLAALVSLDMSNPSEWDEGIAKLLRDV